MGASFVVEHVQSFMDQFENSSRGTCKWCACTMAWSTSSISSLRRTSLRNAIDFFQVATPPGSVSMTPRLSNSEYALATVLRLTRSSSDSGRMEGSASPGRSAPDARRP